MASVYEIKEQTVLETPILLLDCEFRNGLVAHWSTSSLDVSGQHYEGRILRHNLFELGLNSDEGIDTGGRLSLVLANADSYGSQLERDYGFKGARLTVWFVFVTPSTGSLASESRVIFKGSGDSPEEITERTLRVSFSNRLGLQRLHVPEVRIQKRCPWQFPVTEQERDEALSGGSRGQYSRFWRCGYSADRPGGAGNLDGSAAYTKCGYTRADCELRGMFDQDQNGNLTRRFGGVEFVPSSIKVRSYGESGQHWSPVVENEARYNDLVPVLYGTAWYSPPIVFARNDGNLTHLEVLLALGEIQSVQRAIVNDIEIPPGIPSTDMTATGWYNAITAGGRTGAFNADFTGSDGKPIGDPYGSLAALSIVVPNRINDGRSLHSVRVLLQGLKLDLYDTSGQHLGRLFSNNPAWILLDLLLRSGWTPEEIDLGSFARAAAYCDEEIDYVTETGEQRLIPRYQCNLVLSRRRSAAEVIRGVRKASSLNLCYGDGGKLQAVIESSTAIQQPVKPPGSNSSEDLGGGWPAYEFSDGSHGHSGLLRRANGEPALRLWSRSTADCPNRFVFEFQNEFNDYQQDSLTMVDIEDVSLAGQEVSANLAALGVPNFNQAARLMQLQLAKSTRGNCYVEFDTSVRAFGIRPGDLITLTYLREGLQRQPFRVLSISPSTNFETATIAGQIHQDAWYEDNVAALEEATGGRHPAGGTGLPNPLAGSYLDGEGDDQFGIEEDSAASTDGGMEVMLSVAFTPPRPPLPTSTGIPLAHPLATVIQGRGTLPPDRTFYYAVSAIDASGGESKLSFVIRASIPPGEPGNSAELEGLRFSTNSSYFNVYRGTGPFVLRRIASNETLAGSFVDEGLSAELVPPPDENFDHANFYWRLELQPEYAATIHTSSSIGNDSLEMTAGQYAGMVVRITKGRGKGQERAIASNTTTTLVTEKPWEVEPDNTSQFVVCESGWHLAASGATSPIEFTVPNRKGATIHVSGRAANILNRECSPELSPVTRWRIGGAAAEGGDSDVPGPPSYGLIAPGNGTVELVNVAFESLDNTRSISAGTLRMNYWDELDSPTSQALLQPTDETAEIIHFSTPPEPAAGDLLQIDSEVLAVVGPAEGGGWQVLRGQHGTTPAPHFEQTPVYLLLYKVFIVPLARDFFGSPASGEFSHTVALPDSRIACAEFYVTNALGNSEASYLALTNRVGNGLRTRSGGQLTIQVDGYLSVQSAAAPPLVISEPHSVRDVYAIVGEAPQSGDVEMQLRADEWVYCNLIISAGSTTSNRIDGFGLAPLQPDSKLFLDILSVGTNPELTPGRDLTVVIRL